MSGDHELLVQNKLSLSQDHHNRIVYRPTDQHTNDGIVIGIRNVVRHLLDNLEKMYYKVVLNVHCIMTMQSARAQTGLKPYTREHGTVAGHGKRRTQVVNCNLLYSRHLIEQLHQQPVHCRLRIFFWGRDQIYQSRKCALFIHQLERDLILSCIGEDEDCCYLQHAWFIFLFCAKPQYLAPNCGRYLYLKKAMHDLPPDIVRVVLKEKGGV